MGVKFAENSLGHNDISTWKRYRAKPFGGENEQFSRTSVIRSEIKPMLQHFFNALGLRLSMFQSLTGATGNQMQADSKSIEPAFEVISSYIYIYIIYIPPSLPPRCPLPVVVSELLRRFGFYFAFLFRISKVLKTRQSTTYLNYKVALRAPETQLRYSLKGSNRSKQQQQRFGQPAKSDG